MMEVFKEYLGIFIGFIGFISVIIILAEKDEADKWNDIFKGDGRDD